MGNRGFVTVATGDEKYYRAAAHLLRSYQMFHDPSSACYIEGAQRLPFAIIADRHNEFTALFDNVIILREFSRSYFDKLSVLKYIPYDETVFVESDCLAYSDLNEYFDIFKDADEFSVIGRPVPVDAKDGWFLIEETGKYRDRIQFIPRFHSAVIYLRKNGLDKCGMMYDICMDINEHYREYMIGGSRDAIDDKLLALSSAAVGCRPTLIKMYYYTNYPQFLVNRWNPRPRMHCQKNSFNKNHGEEIVDRAIICHWGNFLTKKYLYKREVRSVERLIKGKSPYPYVILSSAVYPFYKAWEWNVFVIKPKIIERLSDIKLLKKIWHKLKG